MADYELTVLNDDRAIWIDPNGAGEGIKVAVNSGGGAGSATVRARLVFPQLTGALLAELLRYADIFILPVVDDGLSVDYSVSDFTIDADGYLTFTLWNHTIGQAEEEGQFFVVVQRNVASGP